MTGCSLLQAEQADGAQLKTLEGRNRHIQGKTMAMLYLIGRKGEIGENPLVDHSNMLHVEQIRRGI